MLRVRRVLFLHLKLPGGGVPESKVASNCRSNVAVWIESDAFRRFGCRFGSRFLKIDFAFFFQNKPCGVSLGLDRSCSCYRPLVFVLFEIKEHTCLNTVDFAVMRNHRWNVYHLVLIVWAVLEGQTASAGYEGIFCRFHSNLQN